ncbi:hypothetical protein DSO57_1003135 [Entomophthora muscae]|uniref:Uncharacterized protein n=1 Tax=Entomophthora muscae TaxID=34485 RepID=A0ACC2RNG8_9FUNG|nr:hypothetical protein DSO57_1003135 [Entomophthora muscae]
MVLPKLLWGLLGAGHAIFDGTYLQHNVSGVAYFRLMTELITSPSDKSSYRMLRLENGLYVLLVSSSMAREATAALDVHTGYRDDPSHVAGLAHLVEHLLFTGSRKYPEKDGFEVVSNPHWTSLKD